ncbi:MAG: hypothetical protein ACJ74O_08295 [Frankiaceae bacterium]
MNRSLLAGAALALGSAAAILVPATNANALQSFTVSVTCENGMAFDATVVSIGSFKEDVTAGNFQVKYAAFQGVVIRDSLNGVSNNQDLVTCHYTGPGTGHYYTLVGFFTPSS